MKIALVLDDSIDRPDGVQQYVMTLAGFLMRAGHEVHVLCSEAADRSDVTVHSLARNVGVTFNGNGLRVPRPTSRRAIRALLEAERYDVIHVQTPHSPLFAARVVDEARRLQARSVRIVGTFHILPDSRVAEWGTHALGRALARNLRKFDAFCAVSAPAAAFAGRAFGIAPRVIPCPVDVSRFAAEAAARVPAPGEDGRLVVSFLGRLVPRKGVLELLGAVALLPGEVRERIELRIGGKGPLADAVAEEVAELGLERVALLGFVAEEDKAAFYADADIAVFPATGGESFGIVLVEAMASGAGVVLAGANPGYLSVIGPRPEVSVDAADDVAFAAALERLVRDAELRAELHAEQAEHVRQFDIQRVGAQVLELYGA
ncbi:phosphatidyl-myo-inositol mannosyltransferase [Demequina sediminis]|uniref:D-inositol 3-phosphate glycosyltransferase n=1 Tax=Demequina sediminis TaxID=1930058 RepID=A0ABP9WEH5_9MICO|nr:glycosyltransferase family 4 protein [Demequina sediminis]BDZ62678.1 GDP-mannose-dependent alpha-(1-2)-phosphatidylinositol mannosyltransferase [Demequina sediminis]